MLKVKSMDNETHKKYTGVGNELILENLSKLLKTNVNVWIRFPVISDVNDSEEEMKKMNNFFKTNAYPEKIELLPYHAMGEHKYGALGRNIEKFEVPINEKLDKLKEILRTYT